MYRLSSTIIILIIIEFDRTNATLEDLYIIILSYTAVVLYRYIIMFMYIMRTVQCILYCSRAFSGAETCNCRNREEKNKTCGVSFMYYIYGTIYTTSAGGCEVSHAGRRLFALMADQGERVVFTPPQNRLYIRMYVRIIYVP